MTLQTVLTLVRAAVRSLGILLTGRVRFPQHRLGDVLELADGERYIVYRETELHQPHSEPSSDRVVLVFRMTVTGTETGESLRDVLFDPLANVATPFFAGMPGFRRKLWLAGERPGDFLELYEWASKEDATRFVETLRSLLGPFDFAGSASFEIVEDDTIESYVANRSIQWRQPKQEQKQKQNQDRITEKIHIPWWSIVALLILFVLLRRVMNANPDETSGAW